jgi:hypothetical protein
MLIYGTYNNINIRSLNYSTSFHIIVCNFISYKVLIFYSPFICFAPIFRILSLLQLCTYLRSCLCVLLWACVLAYNCYHFWCNSYYAVLSTLFLASDSSYFNILYDLLYVSSSLIICQTIVKMNELLFPMQRLYPFFPKWFHISNTPRDNDYVITYQLHNYCC